MTEEIKRNRTHTAISYVILFVLVIIFIAVLIKQKHYYVPISQTPQKSVPQIQPASPKTQSWLGGQLFGTDFKPANKIETYNADNLYEKIDGKADLYLQNDFSSLQCRRYNSNTSQQDWAEVYVYDMAKAKNAFAVYSGQMRSRKQLLGWTQFGYKTSDSIYTAAGNFYFEIILSSDSNGLLLTAESAAKQLVDLALKEPFESFAIHFFPADNLVSNSFKLIRKDGFGCADMENIFSAAYSVNGNSLTAFIADTNDSSSAQVLLEKYHTFLIENGGMELPHNIDMSGSKAVELFGTTDILFRYKNFFAGVRGSAPIEDLTNLAILFKNSLKNDTK
jgi:hypothetical protein